MSRSRLPTGCSPPITVCPPSVSVPPFYFFRSFKLDFDTVKKKLAFLKSRKSLTSDFNQVLSNFAWIFPQNQIRFRFELEHLRPNQ